jgi:hypothetical protein
VICSWVSSAIASSLASGEAGIELVESGETEQPAKRKTLQAAIETFNKFGIRTPPVFSCSLQL